MRLNLSPLFSKAENPVIHPLYNLPSCPFPSKKYECGALFWEKLHTETLCGVIVVLPLFPATESFQLPVGPWEHTGWSFVGILNFGSSITVMCPSSSIFHAKRNKKNEQKCNMNKYMSHSSPQLNCRRHFPVLEQLCSALLMLFEQTCHEFHFTSLHWTIWEQ